MTTQFTPNSEIQKMMDDNKLWNNKFNSKLLNYFPEKSYAYASLSIDPMAYYKTFEEDDSFNKIQSEFESETNL